MYTKPSDGYEENEMFKDDETVGGVDVKNRATSEKKNRKDRKRKQKKKKKVENVRCVGEAIAAYRLPTSQCIVPGILRCVLKYPPAHYKTI